jgi:hypothetical protein
VLVLAAHDESRSYPPDDHPHTEQFAMVQVFAVAPHSVQLAWVTGVPHVPQRGSVLLQAGRLAQNVQVLQVSPHKGTLVTEQELQARAVGKALSVSPGADASTARLR